MVLIPSQSNSGLEHGEGWVVSCHCIKCRRYYTLTGKCNSNVCDGKTYRMHHLVQDADLEDVQALQSKELKYWPAIGRVTYSCSAIGCDLVITIDVTEPRIPQRWAENLVNRDSTMDRLQKLLEEEPARFQELSSPEKLARLLPINYFQQYVTDVCFPLQRNPDGTRSVVSRLDVPLKVARRNKILQVCFGNEFDEFFKSVEFDVDNGGDYMLIPRLDLQETHWVSPDTRRAYFEDLKLEADILCDRLGIAPPASREGGRLSIQPAPVLGTLLCHLLRVTTAETSAKALLKDYDAQDFDLLGVNITTHESLLWFACKAQGQNKPSMRGEVFQALMRVGHNRTSNSAELGKYLEEEGMALVKLQSLQEIQEIQHPVSKEISEAYKSFGIDQPSLSDEYVTNVYRTYMDSAQSAVVKINHRKSLAIIGKARESRSMIDEAFSLTADEAHHILGIPIGVGTGPITYVADVRAQDDPGAKPLIAAALRFFSTEHPDHRVEYLSKAAELDPEGYSGPLPVHSSEARVQQEDVDLALPPGLYNLRNTCYLNSILQYFNTINPVRDIVLNRDQFRLDNTDENRLSRRLGGTGSRLTKGEALLAEKCESIVRLDDGLTNLQVVVDELHDLFTELQGSSSRFVTPKQRLAIAALRTAEELSKPSATKPPSQELGLARESNPSPPPLPARPSPNVPVNSAHGSQTEPTVTVNAVPEHLDTASNVSSQTLVNEDHTYINVSHNSVEEATAITPGRNQPDSAVASSDKAAIVEVHHAAHSISKESEGKTKVDNDAKMEDAAIEDDAKVEENILANLNEASKGTDQQDVEEVMGNILEHLQAAIKPTGTDTATGFQTDHVTETFYWTAAKHLREVDVSAKPKTPYRRSIESSRWITAFPSKDGKIDLYEALDSSFDQEFQEGGFEQFTSIVKASPILHIYLQRSQNEAGRLGRNNNFVEIPEVLYLDRYMESPEGSELFQKRQRSWNIKRALQDNKVIVEPKQQQSAPATKINEPDYVIIDDFTDADHDASTDNGELPYSIMSGKLDRDLDEEHVPREAYAPDNEDTVMLGSPRYDRLSPDTVSQLGSEAINHDGNHRHELAELFSDMKQHRYRLHAVICHGGNLGSGHYWVWIYDFEQRVWRRYNDTAVEVEPDSEKVLKELNNSSHPYYVAYVRESDVDELVTVPRRNVAPNDPSPYAQDIEMQDAQAHVEHVEDGDPPPYTPDLA